MSLFTLFATAPLFAKLVIVSPFVIATVLALFMVGMQAWYTVVDWIDNIKTRRAR